MHVYAETPTENIKIQNKVKISWAESLLQTCVKIWPPRLQHTYKHYGCNARARIRDTNLEDFLCARSDSAKPKGCGGT